MRRGPQGPDDTRFHRDSCGVGLVADSHGRRSHTVLAMALEALENLAHRGAVSADRRTGDGAGVLTQIPHAFFRAFLEGRGVTLGEDGDLGVGTFFLPRESARARARGRRVVERELERGGLEVLAWRRVPVDLEILGRKARATRPAIRQVLVRRPSHLASGGTQDGDAFERLLFLTRKRIEASAAAQVLEGFYTVSFSHRTLVYKGTMLAPHLADFYLDLQDPSYDTALALFHQRYSTNTRPDWRLAQPFRFLAHNGEINTVEGNRNWMTARQSELRSRLWGEKVEELQPVISSGGSDSAALDNVLELLVQLGREPLHAQMMLMPQAEEAARDVHEDLVAFYRYHAGLMEPWEGPAALVFSDGRIAAAALDRVGLRPLRYWVTVDGLVVAGSETGMVGIPDDRVIRRGRLGPGQILAVDTAEGRLLEDEEIKLRYARRRPYARWLEECVSAVPSFEEPFAATELMGEEELRCLQRLFGYGREDLDRVLAPMALEGKQPVASMGDDTPLPVHALRPPPLYRFFKQRFAQVTNPPIDPLREHSAFSLRTLAGPWGSEIREHRRGAHVLELASPILDPRQLAWLQDHPDPSFTAASFHALFPVAGGAAGLEAALTDLCRRVEEAVDAGSCLILLSDRQVDRKRAPIPMLLATGAVHQHLIRVGKRMRTSLICDVGDCWQDHHVACLLGFGATLVHPYLAYAGASALAGEAPGEACARYRQALEQGLLKILSKLGVCSVASYQGAQLFEALGLHREVLDLAFSGVPSAVPTLRLEGLAAQVLSRHGAALRDGRDLAELGLYRYRKGGEHHAFNPRVFKALHRAVRQGDGEAFREYCRQSEEGPPAGLRDLLELRPEGDSVPLEEVEPVEEIARRFTSAAMSLGALSREAHEALAVAMNRLGGRSNSGEGGEDPVRFLPYGEVLPGGDDGGGRWRPRPGDWGNSAIKQIASGRFGVTPEYLMSAQELEIKMAQGSKPGEGGQIPGSKVSVEIARLRHARPGVALISPPPHHDIYSIEDLAQLIYDLKRINPRARVGVKLVATRGVGTIAAGVVKAYADYVQISGHGGGTGASPLTSIYNAGLPWEVGLAETQRVLLGTGLRDRVRLRVDGGLRTGRDVLVGGLLGAEEFNFGTTALVALGCVMARQCHLNTCPVGIATQKERLRHRFPGTPGHVVAFLTFVAEQVRHLLAHLGVRTFEEIVGRSDLLVPRQGVEGPPVDLSELLPESSAERRSTASRRLRRNDRPDRQAPLDEVVWRRCRGAVRDPTPILRRFPITNRDRSVGAKLSGYVAFKTRGRGLAPGHVDARFTGVAGQSFGVFLESGLRFVLVGEAQDYVGKGMHGGELVLRPPPLSRSRAEDSVIAGNAVLYGATGGVLFARGRVGERFCVRNSGAVAVAEGCGDHGCEYMTRGIAVVLGPVGYNFAAGMTGGLAYVLDPQARLAQRLHRGQVEPADLDDLDDELLRRLLKYHREHTGSAVAESLLRSWPEGRDRFVKVQPRGPASAAESSLEERRRTLESLLAG